MIIYPLVSVYLWVVSCQNHHRFLTPLRVGATSWLPQGDHTRAPPDVSRPPPGPGLATSRWVALPRRTPTSAPLSSPPVVLRQTSAVFPSLHRHHEDIAVDFPVHSSWSPVVSLPLTFLLQRLSSPTEWTGKRDERKKVALSSGRVLYV